MTLQERTDKAIAYCRWLQAHGMDERLDPRRGFGAMVACHWVLSCLEGRYDASDDFHKPYQLSECACDACEAERARCGEPSRRS